MKALLLRVGIDRGFGGTLAPIFPDGTFEFIPIPEYQETAQTLTYRTARCRRNRKDGSNGTLAGYVPEKLADVKIHVDPDFEHFTYGDPTVKKRALVKLERDDLLVFYAGLTPQGFKGEDALYVVGFFTVDQVIDLCALPERELQAVCRRYADNADIKGGYLDAALVIGQAERSRLLDKAVKISERRPDRAGVLTHALKPELAERLGISGFIQRSIPPRWIQGEPHLAELRVMLDMS